MIASCLNRRVLVAFCLAVFTAASIGAQAPAKEEPFVPQVGQRGVLMLPVSPTRIRAVFHLDIDDEGLGRAIAAVKAAAETLAA